jgi:salicylate hydroxylase
VRAAVAADGDLSAPLAPARQVAIAGAGIGGLTAALSLARVGLPVEVFEQAQQLEEAGAGIQLSPNATRILIDLGLGERLMTTAVAPEAIRVMNAGNAREIVRIPLGAQAETRYGAPFWVIHRADLQAVLADAVRAHDGITLSLGTRVEDYTAHADGVTLQTRKYGESGKHHCSMLIGADGLWSAVRSRMRRETPPIFRHRTAWRALVPAADLSPQWREPLVHLWLGRDAHLVHYPVKGGALINIVAIAEDEWQSTVWTAAGDRQEVLRRFGRWDWAASARDLLAVPDQWSKWALHDRKAAHRGRGPVALLGDASHPMLPFLAQGAGMAIEDAAVLAACLSQQPDKPARAMRLYEKQRRKRTQRAQETARKQGSIYGRSGPEAAIRNLVLRLMGGGKVLSRYDWVYQWQAPSATLLPPPPEPVAE